MPTNRPTTWWCVAASLAFLALAVVSVWAPGEIEPDLAAAGAALLIATVVSVAATPVGQAALARVGKVSIGPLAVELVQAERAAEESPPADGEKQTPGEARSLFEIRMTLESRLAYIAKHMLTDRERSPSGATYVTVGSLAFDGYLTKAQALTASLILTETERGIGALDSNAKKRFLTDADVLAHRLRSTVHRIAVEKALRRRYSTSLRPRGANRPDDVFIDNPGDGPGVLVIPRFAGIGKLEANNIAASVDRARELQETGQFKRVIVVVPRGAGEQADPPTGRLAFGRDGEEHPAFPGPEPGSVPDGPFVVRFEHAPAAIEALGIPRKDAQGG